MPASGWNGKFEAVGNGGWAGTISYPAMAQALARGYATTSTDTGHSTPGASFAFGHPEKLIDYAYRSEHEMTVKAKAVINAFYGNAPTRSYFNGCSTGGRQALIEASRFPDDFDGIIAGAAANPKTHLDTWRIWMGLETLKDPETRIPQEKYPAIHQAVLAACDALDGLKDGLISRSHPLPFRSAGAGVQGGRRTELPDAEAGSIGQDHPRPGEEPAHRRGDLSGLSAGDRAAMGSPHRRTRSVRHGPRSVPAWCSTIRSGTGGRSTSIAIWRRPRSRLNGLLTAIDPASISAFVTTRRKAPDVSRLERSGHRAAGERELLQERAERGRRRERRRARCDCSWCPAWDTAAAARARTPST